MLRRTHSSNPSKYDPSSPPTMNIMISTNIAGTLGSFLRSRPGRLVSPSPSCPQDDHEGETVFTTAGCL